MRKSLKQNVENTASYAAHATKKDTKRRHINHLFPKGFVPILAAFGAVIFAARFCTFGARRNNGLELYIGEPARWNFWSAPHRTRPCPQWRQTDDRLTLPKHYNDRG